MEILKTQGLTKSFGGLVAVNHVSLIFEEGQLTSIIGPNGAGKTTLFNLLTGLLSPDSGRIYFRNKDITSLQPHRRVKEGIARSFQILNIFDEISVFENIRIAVQAEKGHGHEILSSINSLDEVNEKTFEIIKSLGFKGKENTVAINLSYGYRRILEIGIVLGTNPKLLLLDEPTSGLGSEETSTMTKFIEKLSRDLSLVLIEHDMNVVLSISARIIVLDQGEVIADGPPDEIKRNHKVQEAYLGGL